MVAFYPVEDYIIHIVKWGDRLEPIAKKYSGVKDCNKIKSVVNDIAQMNGWGKETDTMRFVGGKEIERNTNGERYNEYINGKLEKGSDNERDGETLIPGMELKIPKSRLSAKYL